MGLPFTVNNSIKGPEIDHVDTLNGIVYFKPHDFRIDVFVNTTKKKGPHAHKNGKIYPDHKGKRFKLHSQLNIEDNSWTLDHHKGDRRRYFKFAFRDANLDRTTFSTAIIASATIGEKCKLNLISM